MIICLLHPTEKTTFLKRIGIWPSVVIFDHLKSVVYVFICIWPPVFVFEHLKSGVVVFANLKSGVFVFDLQMCI